MIYMIHMRDMINMINMIDVISVINMLRQDEGTKRGLMGLAGISVDFCRIRLWRGCRRKNIVVIKYNHYNLRTNIEWRSMCHSYYAHGV
jgi:hypothetical protein